MSLRTDHPFFSGEGGGGGGLGNSQKNSCTPKTAEIENHAVKPNGKKD